MSALRRAGGALDAAILALVLLPLAMLIAEVATEPEALVRVLSRDGTWIALARSLGLAVAVGAIAIVLALPVAWLTHATDVPARRTLRALSLLPLSVPSYVGGFVVVAAFAPGGLVPLFDPYSALGALLALSFTHPLVLLAVNAALERLDPRQWEAARSLGCTPRQAFVRVVLPHLRPALSSSALLAGLYAVGDFGAVSLTRYESLSYLVYLRHKSLFERDEAAPLCLLLVALSAALAWLVLRVFGRPTVELRAQRRAFAVLALGAARWPAFALCAGMVALFVLAPLGVVGGWYLRGVQLGRAPEWPWQAAGQSAGLGLAAVAVIIPLVLVSVLTARFALSDARASVPRWLLTYLGYALPGIAIALAMITVATAGPWATLLYPSYGLLLAAYAIRFSSLGVGTLDDALGSQSPSLFWAARSLGSSPLEALSRVVLPLAWPALAATAIAVFVAVIKELPVTLLLSPFGVSTLATRIWTLTEDAYFAATAPAVLLLVALAALMVLLGPDLRARRDAAHKGEPG